MPFFTVYENSTGRVLRSGGCPDDSVKGQAENGETSIETTKPFNDETFYWDGQAFVERQDVTATWNKLKIKADGVDEAVLGQLPIPCTLRVNGEEYVVDDGDLEISMDHPGVCTIELDLPQYKITKWEVIGEA